MNNPYLYLGFDELVNKEAEVSGYSLFLINNTSYKFIYQFEWKYGMATEEKGNDFLLPGSNKRIASMNRSQLNDKPIFQINVQPITTSGKEAWTAKEIKIKAKQFFSKLTLAPQFNRKMHLYELFTEFGEVKKSKAVNSLRHYTKQHQAPVEDKPLFQGTLTNLADLGQLASFPKLIDLHMEKLMPGKKLNGSEALSYQLKAFDKYLEKAIMIGMPQFYVVHGKGAGRLEEEIRQRLEDRSEVDSFEGGFHQGFGTGGATKVFLKL